jgi:hypothetical protein
MADVNKKRLTTRERMLLGAFVNAYSKPVMLAKISEKALRKCKDERKGSIFPNWHRANLT